MAFDPNARQLDLDVIHEVPPGLGELIYSQIRFGISRSTVSLPMEDGEAVFLSCARDDVIIHVCGKLFCVSRA
eukprot:721599-Pyramimonas_sp.AAC.1